MARARNIKPGFFKNEILGVADPLYSLLFEGLWILADRAGKLEDRPLRIKAEVFPYREGANVDSMLDWLHVNGFIVRYQVCSKKYILVLEFVKHQNPHKNETESEIPDPEKIGTTSEIIGSTRADSLSTDSLSTDSGFLIPDYPIPEKKDKAQAPIDQELPDWIPVEAWDGYAEMRKKIRKPMTARAKRLVFKSLEVMKEKGHDVGKILDESTKNDWISVYEPKQKPQQSEVRRGSDEYVKLHKSADWVRDAGFENIWNAMDSGCYHDTAHRFTSGKKQNEAVA